jgi:monofunctional glycosyltransferase
MRKLLLLFGICAGFYLLLFQVFHVLTDVGELKNSYPKVVYDANSKTTRIEISSSRPASWVGIGAVSPLAVSAIVLSEDWAFYQHNGFDWEQIRDAFRRNLEEGRFARGGSTITQQVVKNVYLSKEKTIWRKVQEAILAVRLEQQLDKRRILEIYLNVVEFGEGLYGIGPASRFYFSKAPGELSAKEGAFLAMLLPSPRRYSVSFRKRALTAYASGTVRSILGKLLATKRITEEEFEEAMMTPLSFEDVQLPEQELVPDEEEEFFDYAGAEEEEPRESPDLEF